MLEKVESIKKELENYTVNDAEELESFRMKFISRKNVINDLFESLNQLKNLAQEKFDGLIASLNVGDDKAEQFEGDLTLPNVANELGTLHPLTITYNRIVEIFERLGFSVKDGPEVEDDFHNFTALNFPENHPAREMQDTFFIEKNPDILLRTHTSNVQIRLMEHGKPPFRSIMPGRVYRNEAISARAHCFSIRWKDYM